MHSIANIGFERTLPYEVQITSGASMERLLLQIATAFSAVVLLVLGLSGTLLGVQFLHGSDAALDSFVRLLSGTMAGLGLVLLSTIPHVERHRERFTIVTFVAFVGGLAHLYGFTLRPVPSVGNFFGMFMELIYGPLLWLLQRHVARRAAPHPH